MSMSTQSRREYLNSMKKRYLKTKSKDEKTKIINEVIELLGYHRKYVITALNQPPVFLKPKRNRNRPLKYLEAMPVVESVWEALDYPCAERLHPVLFETAELLAKHNELGLNPTISEQLQLISRATLARRLAKWRSPKRTLPQAKPEFKIRKQVPIDIYSWDEQRPGALEVDLVEHNGGSALGHFACTLSVVDIVTGYSRRRAVLGKGQKGVFTEIENILNRWPFAVWGFHSDSGGEFINGHLYRFCKKTGLLFTRSRPYRKNDNAHVEQKNRQFVREIVGYERYDCPEEVAWLNEVYALLDPYANLFLPMRKVIFKERQGAKVKKRYDIAKTPFQRLIEKDVLTDKMKIQLSDHYQSLNPLALHRQIENLLDAGPLGFTEELTPEKELSISLS
jgi:hypothetical protein